MPGSGNRDTGFIAVQPPSGGLQDVKDWVFEQMVRLAIFNQQYREAVASRNYPKYRTVLGVAQAAINSPSFASASPVHSFDGIGVPMPAVASAGASPAVISVTNMGEDWQEETSVTPVIRFYNSGSASGTLQWQMTCHWTNDNEVYSIHDTQTLKVVIEGTADKQITAQFDPVAGDGKLVNSRLAMTFSRLPDTPASQMVVTQTGFKGVFDGSGTNEESGK